MKNISLLLVAAISLSAFLTSCNSDKSNETPVASSGKIIATVDGTAWESDGIAIISNNSISVGGQSGDKVLQATVFKDDVVGTYDVKGIGELTTFTPEAMVAYGNSGLAAFASIYFDNDVSVGTVIITEIDQVNKTVSGTFHSKVKNYNDGSTVEITNGSFTKIPYTNEAQSSIMSAKIDGVEFNSDIVVSGSAMGTLVLNGQTAGAQQIITISFPVDISVGTYQLGELGSGQYTTYTKSGNIFTSVSGTLKITAHDKTNKEIEGTFNFIAEPFGFEAADVSATEGEFSVMY